METNEIKKLTAVLDHHLEVAQKRAKATRKEISICTDQISSREMRCDVLKLKTPPVKPPGKPQERKPSKYVQWANAGFPKGGPVTKRESQPQFPAAHAAASITIEPPKVKTAAPPPPSPMPKPVVAAPVFPARGQFEVVRPASPQVRIERPQRDAVNIQTAIKIERPARALSIQVTK